MTTENYEGYIDWISSDKTKAKYAANFVPPTEPYVMGISCQSCGHWPLKTVIDLGYMPAVNAMHRITETIEMEPFFPTVMSVCERCELVQLSGEPPDSDLVFPLDYPYTTSSSKPLIENFKQLAQEVSELKPGKLSVCDIGSNDGTLLSFFKERGHKVLGVEPTDVAGIADKGGIDTIQAFFNDHKEDGSLYTTAEWIAHKYGPFDVVTCCNCFAHMPDVNGVVRGIKKILKPDGIFVSESHYLFGLLRKVQYDTIYHEHLRFYSINSLACLLKRHDMAIFDVKNIPTHGGSIRVYAQNIKTSKTARWTFTVEGEPTRGDLEKELKTFVEMVIRSRAMFRYKMCEVMDTTVGWNNNLVGIGAPSRGTILINYLGLNHNDMSCVAERSGSLKVGRLIPGTRIPVVTEDYALEQNPDYALILSWHMADAIMQNWRAKGYKGRFIIPLPEPRIVS